MFDFANISTCGGPPPLRGSYSVAGGCAIGISTGVAQLSLHHGCLTCGSVVLGAWPESCGVLVVGEGSNDPDACLITDVLSIVRGQLLVRNGAKVFADLIAIDEGTVETACLEHSTALVSGPGTQVVVASSPQGPPYSLAIGSYNAPAILTIQDGASLLTNGGKAVIGWDRGNGGSGTILVTGEGSRWINSESETFVGGLDPERQFGASNGTLRIESGADAQLESIVVGNGFRNGAVGLIEVTGTASTLITAGNASCSLGGNATGILRVSDGGRAVLGAVTVGVEPDGLLAVSGVDSLVRLSALHVATFEGSIAPGSGAVVASGGGLVEVATLVEIADPGVMDVGSGGAIIVGDVADGPTFGAVRIQASGSLGGTGTIVGNLVNSGTISPGFSPGRLTVSGDFAQLSGGALEIEIGGSAAGTDFDALVVQGAASLGGTLRVTFIDGYVPSAGEAFNVVEANQTTGDFAAIELPSGYLGSGTIGPQGFIVTMLGPTTIPTLSGYSLAALALGIVIGATVVLRRRVMPCGDPV